MPTTHSAQQRAPEAPTIEATHQLAPPPRIVAPEHEHDARSEIERLRSEIEHLVRVDGDAHARDAVDAALESIARLQVVTANIDACRPPAAQLVGSVLVSLADARLTGHPDAIERGMTYTSDNQMRLLQHP